MDTSATSSRILELERLIRHHNKKYFLENDPEISDVEFDALYKELQKLSPASPALYEIVGEAGEVEHPTPMLSLDKRFAYDDVLKWVKDTNDTEYLVEPKYDGMAARYQNGILASRGDGTHGENLTQRFKDLHVVGKLPADKKVPVIGEIIIPHSYFESVLKGEYKNPRNAVVGIMKSKVLKPAGIQAIRDHTVQFVIYDEGVSLRVKQADLLNKEKWEELLEQVLQVDYPLDGVVLKCASLELRKKLGATEHHEKWAIAYKFPAERKWTTVVDIKDQVGRTGRITSVAVLEPVELSGATVTNVTLHNAEFIVSSGIQIGSKVEICRSGEVIPFIVQVEGKRLTKDALSNDSARSKRLRQEARALSGGPTEKEHFRETYKIPTHCPICNTALRMSGKYLECPNEKCPARQALFYEYFFKTLGVEELGAKTIERFINEFGIKDVIDFYDLPAEKIAQLDGFGAKSGQNITTNLRNTLNGNITESQLLQALGIFSIGPAGSKWLISHFGFQKLPALTVAEVLEVKGIGTVKAEHFVRDIKEKWPIVENLLKRNLTFQKKRTSSTLSGMVFAITGKKAVVTRDELISLIEQNGGQYRPSITKDVTHLIAGDDPGSKLKKAEALGIQILTEQELLNKIR